MSGRINLLQLANRNLRVDLRALEVGVAEPLLDKAHIGTAFQHECGHAMTEEMIGARLSDVGSLDVLPSEMGEAAGSEAFTR